MLGGDTELRDLLIDLILEHERTRPRSQQTELGPSEIGDPCPRRIAYKVARFPEPESFVDDPWFAIMGTAVHAHIASVLDWENSLAEAQGHDPLWLVERRVSVRADEDGSLEGSMDAYNFKLRRPIDHKLVGKTKHDKVRRNGPPKDYHVQIQCYGVGAMRMGLEVDKVSIAFYPRWEKISKALYVWTGSLRPDIVDKALERVDIIVALVRELNPMGNPYNFTKIKSVPSEDCRFCPWLRPGEDTGMTCPGNTVKLTKAGKT